MKIATRLPTRRECTDAAGHFSIIDFMGYSLNTGCENCDGTGYILRVQGQDLGGRLGDDYSYEGRIECCPVCNPNAVLPRSVCCHCKDRVPAPEVPPLGDLYQGALCDLFDDGRYKVFKGYLCEQCYQTEIEDGARLKLIRTG